MEHRNLFAPAQHAKSARQLDRDAGRIFRKNAALQGPEYRLTGAPDEFAQQHFPDTLSTAVFIHVDAVLGDS